MEKLPLINIFSSFTFLFSITLSQAADSITPSSFIRDGEKLVSSSESYNGSIKLSCTGPWNGFFFGAAPFDATILYEPILVDNKDEIYYSYQSYNSPNIMTLKINPSGTVQRLIWNERSRGWEVVFTTPASFCLFYDHCGANSVCNFDKTPNCECSKGFKPKSQHNQTRPGTCVRSQSSDCKSGDRFIMVDDIKLPDLLDVSLNESMNLKECEAECLKNCTCRAYANSKVTGGGSGCLMSFGDLIDITKAKFHNGQPIYIRVPASELDHTKEGLLGWEARIRIIEGIVQGLLYIHQHSRLRVIHRDLKVSNSLLDSDMNPKISDFGLARIFGDDELQSNTRRIVGTYFGVLLLETLSSKRNTRFFHTDSVTLLGHAWNLWKNDKA
ncbi:hypothetical protein WN944_001780 [Citrus x changshan-huyou]|uniref:non-specific serine/threonine protein kinase n=1 Tax=Citrus x changshan-huyou TaxID=2935761 RepID=A0AAP0MFB0_9ROSI